MTTDLTAEEIAHLRDVALIADKCGVFAQVEVPTLLRLLDQLSRLKEANRSWIRCADRMPEPGQHVLIYGPWCGVCTSWITTGKRKSYFAGNQSRQVTHWMPLPMPPAPEAAS